MHPISNLVAIMAVMAIPASAFAEGMGPAAFMWPADRPWTADADNTPPCGSPEGPGNRTQFPMRNGQVALLAQDESYDIELSISYKNDPKSNQDFQQLINAMSFREMDLGHTCINIADPPASVQPGSNATLQIKYIADFDKPENQTFYACADITYVSAIINNDKKLKCFNATEPNTNKPKPTAVSTSGEGGSKLSGGAIAGIVVGSVVGVALIVAGGLFIYRRKQRRLAALRQQHSARGVKWDEPRSERDSASHNSVRMQNLNNNNNN